MSNQDFLEGLNELPDELQNKIRNRPQQPVPEVGKNREQLDQTYSSLVDIVFEWLETKKEGSFFKRLDQRLRQSNKDDAYRRAMVQLGREFALAVNFLVVNGSSSSEANLAKVRGKLQEFVNKNYNINGFSDFVRGWLGVVTFFILLRETLNREVKDRADFSLNSVMASTYLDLRGVDFVIDLGDNRVVGVQLKTDRALKVVSIPVGEQEGVYHAGGVSLKAGELKGLRDWAQKQKKQNRLVTLLAVEVPAYDELGGWVQPDETFIREFSSLWNECIKGNG